jgi:hypothetical protein
VTATEVTLAPEIDGAVLALVLGTLWLVFGVGRRGDGETPAA